MITKRVVRVTAGQLDGSFGPDRGKRIIVAFIPGDGDKVPDVLEFRPFKTRRAERIAVIDAYRYALRCRVNLEILTKARLRKAKKAERLASDRIARAEKRLFNHD